MSWSEEMRLWRAHAAKIAAAMVAAMLGAVALSGCTGNDRVAARPEPQASAAPPPPPAPSPPPVDLAGRWKLAAASGGACFMNLGSSPGAVQGTIAPEGGCPGNFFTSRKWTFERDALIIRNHKGEPLAQLAFSGGRFEGREPNGAALSLSR
jgi:protease inhibitor Inh